MVRQTGQTELRNVGLRTRMNRPKHGKVSRHLAQDLEGLFERPGIVNVRRAVQRNSCESVVIGSQFSIDAGSLESYARIHCAWYMLHQRVDHHIANECDALTPNAFAREIVLGAALSGVQK